MELVAGIFSKIIMFGIVLVWFSFVHEIASNLIFKISDEIYKPHMKLVFIIEIQRVRFLQLFVNFSTKQKIFKE